MCSVCFIIIVLIVSLLYLYVMFCIYCFNCACSIDFVVVLVCNVVWFIAFGDFVFDLCLLVWCLFG